ncbi:Transposon Tf2-9 polyprotein [Euphorbia peplus]|nr:Transposon Tf2-9 polyprotein [Euphorbia peplus]
MVTLFHDMIHKEMEVYVDDMVAKSRENEDHVEVLRKVFQRLRKYNIRLNPAKCVFGVTAGKLLGFIVSRRGIEADPSKIKAIREMQPPKTEKEVRGFLGRLNFIARFIAQMTTKGEPIFKLLRKNNPGTWDHECQLAFDKIREYLQNPPILHPPSPDKPLLLYLTVCENSMGAFLAQVDESGTKERAIYYISKKFIDCESQYTPVEKTCAALIWSAHRLRHYMLNNTTRLISMMDPIKFIFEKPALTGKIARWQVMLAEYDVVFVPQKAIKGSAISNFLAENPVPHGTPLDVPLPDEETFTTEEETEHSDYWVMRFDGA